MATKYEKNVNRKRPGPISFFIDRPVQRLNYLYWMELTAGERHALFHRLLAEERSRVNWKDPAALQSGYASHSDDDFAAL